MREGRIKLRNFFRLFCGLLIVVLFSTVTLSKYMTQVTGSSSAAVAGVSLEINNSTTPIDISNLSPGTSTSYTFSVVNFKDNQVSDVTLDYTVRVSTTGNLPITYTLAPADDEASTENLVTTTNTNEGTGSQTWTGGVLAGGEKVTHSYKLTATWAVGEYDISYMNEIDAVEIVVDATQRSNSE